MGTSCQRREFNQWGLALCVAWLLGAHSAQADTFSSDQALRALRLSLSQGAAASVRALGASGGFWNQPSLRIGLPPTLERAQPVLEMLGQGRAMEELRQGINRAAEQAMPLALPLLEQAIRGLQVRDAQAILQGGDHAVTDYFARATRPALTAKFLPQVSQVTDRLSLARQYDRLLQKVRALGVKGDDMATHVTRGALDGLFKTIAAQEQALRQNPAQASSRLLREVFGRL